MRTAWFAVVLAVTLLGAAGMAAANPADSLVAAWLFDEDWCECKRFIRIRPQWSFS